MSGTTTVEAKTGYHLTRDGELADVRMLRSLESEPGMPRMHVTFLAAHSVPPEFFGRRADYIDAVSSWCPMRPRPAPTAWTSTARTAVSPRPRPGGS